ncbi:diadenylate cyclase CdaA [Sporolituus thermophilus]|uniref:Diadenylate cyclase n=1 Tax=Sporolituus thermophilus DSM 23256 TaxID=1123285 RepID=A0A1G7LRK2_9FIRM|nr:diadenylate cyclase CdaA [Sporolituus thermophilus]SDF51599.1 diadenylate cyclase [Sporolituus thermophilus DSM 23256]
MLLQIRGILSTITLLDIVDILIVAFVLYKLYFMIKDTRAVALLKGLVVLLFATLVSKWLGLNVINWLLQKTFSVLLVALPIVFQPELRRALEQLGRGGFLRKRALLNEEETARLLEELAKAVKVLAQNKIGALLVIEREIGLNDYIETGLKVDGLVSSEFIINIFIPNTPMHDGAVIIRGNRIMAAGCLLPLTEDLSLSKELGTRHRAAIGITEQTDAVVVVVSEETGTISLARGGHLIRYLDTETLKEKLKPLFATKSSALIDFLNWRWPHGR